MLAKIALLSFRKRWLVLLIWIALLAERAMQLAKPQVSGIFWRGWTLPGRGARGCKVEDSLGRNFQGL